MFASVLAQPAGRWLQRFVTTRGDVGDLEVVGTKQFLPGVRKVFTRERA